MKVISTDYGKQNYISMRKEIKCDNTFIKKDLTFQKLIHILITNVCHLNIYRGHRPMHTHLVHTKVIEFYSLIKTSGNWFSLFMMQKSIFTS